MKRIPWEVRIKPASNGVIVKVGCVSLLYTNDIYGTFIADLDLYLKDHDAAIKAIDERWGLKVMEGQSDQTVGPREPRPTTRAMREPRPASEEATEGQGREMTPAEANLVEEVALEEKRARR